MQCTALPEGELIIIAGKAILRIMQGSRTGEWVALADLLKQFHGQRCLISIKHSPIVETDRTVEEVA